MAARHHFVVLQDQVFLKDCIHDLFCENSKYTAPVFNHPQTKNPLQKTGDFDKSIGKLQQGIEIFHPHGKSLFESHGNDLFQVGKLLKFNFHLHQRA